MLNERRHIRGCLKAIRANTLDPATYELLVVDGGSTDGCLEIACEEGAHLPNFRLLNNPARIVPTAMNRGIRAARGTYIIRMDAHSECAPDYLQNCVDELRANSAQSVWNVGGTWNVKPESQGYIAEALALLVQHPFGVGNAKYRLAGSGFVDTVPFGAFPREIFEKIGLYREDLPVHEDFELNARIRKAGGKIYLSSKISCIYFHPASLSAAMRKAWRYGYWDAISWKRYPYCFALRHAMPLLLVLIGLVLALLALSFHSAQLVLIFLVAAYIDVSLVAALHISHRHGWRYLPAIPPLFMLRHIVFGFGSLLGLLLPLHRRVQKESYVVAE